MVNRRGAAGIGCLGWLLILSVSAYVGLHVGAPYFRYYTYRDAISQQVRYATFRNDDAIRKEIWAAADSIGLPENAYHIQVERVPGAVRVTGQYDDTWQLVHYIHLVHFIIDQEGPI